MATKKRTPTRRARRHPLAPLAGIIRMAVEADRLGWTDQLPQPKVAAAFSEAEFVSGYNQALADVRAALMAGLRR